MQLIILIRQGRWPGNGRLTGRMTSHTVLTGRQRQTQQWQLSDGPSRQIQFHWPAAVRPWKGLEMGRCTATQRYVQFWLCDGTFWIWKCKLHVRTTWNICFYYCIFRTSYRYAKIQLQVDISHTYIFSHLHHPLLCPEFCLCGCLPLFHVSFFVRCWRLWSSPWWNVLVCIDMPKRSILGRCWISIQERFSVCGIGASFGYFYYIAPFFQRHANS